MRGWERIVVEPVGEDRLRMHRASKIPAVGVAGVKRIKTHVARLRQHAAALGDRGYPHAVPRGDRAPSLHAMMLHRIAGPRHRLQLIERERLRLAHPSADMQTPGA